MLKNTAARNATEQLEELLTELQQTAVLEEEEEKNLKDEIERLVEESEKTPLTSEKWETLDALRERVRDLLLVRRPELAPGLQEGLDVLSLQPLLVPGVHDEKP